MSYIKDKVHQIRIPLELCRGSHWGSLQRAAGREGEKRWRERCGPPKKNFGVTPPIV